MITKIHHVGIAVRSLEAALRFYRDRLGLPLMKLAPVPDQGVEVALLAAGETEVELLEPTFAGTGVARFLDRRGEGMHHLCFESGDIGRDLTRLKERGVAVIDQAPRRGIAGMIAFLHPQATAGILVELVTPFESSPAPASPCRLDHVVAGVDDPSAVARLYQDLFGAGIRSKHAKGRAFVLTSEGAAFLEFRRPGGREPDPAEQGLSGLAFVVEDRSRIDDVRLAIKLGLSASHGVKLALADRDDSR